MPGPGSNWQGKRPAFELFQGFALSSVIAGLEMSGDLSVLADGGIDIGCLPGRNSEETALLAASLRYLAQRGVTTEQGGLFTLTDYGAAIYRDRGFLLWLVGGYGEPLRRLDAFLRLGKRYGKDFIRDGRWVADGTAMMTAESLVPGAIELLGRISFDSILDLGCGNAQFLTDVCGKFGVRGIGVDVSPGAYAEAEKIVADAGLRDQVQLVLSDVRALDQVPGLDRVQLVVTFYLLHEFFAISREAVVGYLADLSGRLPARANLVIAEIEPAIDRDVGQPFVPEYAYAHALMNQRLLSADDWTEVLFEGGFAVRGVFRSGSAILLHCENRRRT
jgi:SAM-dependent methyltransferase